MPGPLKADPGDFTFVPENPVAPSNPVASALRENPALGATGGVGAFAREQSNQAEQRAREAQTEGFQRGQEERTEGFSNQQLRTREQELEPYGPQIPIPGDTVHALQQFRNKLGSITVQRVLAAPEKKGMTGASAGDINKALDQAERLIPMLGTTPGPAANIAGAVRWYQSHSGYPKEAAFGGVSASLADMIPKALAGRSSQSAIQNALQNMVPSIWDTQQSADAKLKNLRELFMQAGALPRGAGSPDMPPASMIPEGMRRQFSNGKWYENRKGLVVEVTP